MQEIRYGKREESQVDTCIFCHQLLGPDLEHPVCLDMALEAIELRQRAQEEQSKQEEKQNA